ncbi:uncharacterized protein RHO25_006696 [Cercospora beticola]|uniref:CENP-V/GFA domain-containing protein n=1 Tax=Cercospora beticola TaxID=122368 RepID=A0ABZ0NR57_CERBT|nr:hypothetical protein RHO25_006696 [Cercospora beticola]CAK1363087.1 unnamed protein product [Cercospora beticola]
MVNDRSRNQATISMATFNGVLAGEEAAIEPFIFACSNFRKVTLGPRSTTDHQLFECTGCGPDWAAVDAEEGAEEAEEAPLHTHMGVWFDDTQRRAMRAAEGG